MNRYGLSPEEWFMVGVVTCCFSGFAGYAAGQSEGFSKADAAAWSQSVFSLVAIGVAVWIARSDHRRQARLSAEAEKHSVLGVVILINRGIALIEALSSTSFGRASESAIHSLHIIAERLESLDLITHPSPVLLRQSLHAANNIRIYIDDAKEGINMDRKSVLRYLEKESGLILKFYGLSGDDLPKERGRFEASA